jgi:ribokinase
MATVIVIGAINLDCLTYIPHFPNEGDNIRVKDLRCSLGGRGANQAVALTNLKVAALLLGKVGNDFPGDYALSILRKYKVNTEYVFKSNSGKTGICSIMISPDGENTILGFPAINRMIQPGFLMRFEYLFEIAQWLSISLEYPLDVVEFALKLARKYGLKTVLDPSPLIELPEQNIWDMVDYALPNKKEIEILTGEEEMLQGAIVLKNWGVGEVIIKQGSKGSSFLYQDNLINVPAFPVKSVVDTTGAGDLYNAAFIYGLMQSDSISRAARIANLVASYSVQKPGACESFPQRREIDWEQLEKRKKGLFNHQD